MWPPSPGAGAWRMGLLLSQSVCAVRDADLLLGTGRQLPDQYLRSVPPGNDEQPARRLMVLLVVAIPPFVLAYSGMVSFRQRALFCRGVQRRHFIDYADPDAQGRPPAWRSDPGLDLSGLDDPSAYPMLHCVVVSLQRRLRDSIRGGLPTRRLVIRLCFAPRPVHAGAVFFICHLSVT